ncbi:Conserved oligomeric Golgi complex subunit 2 [Blomia tropicalis]|nr:Conserved oligomeric Golgi complex subunit 2 [Blomia tropicalis]
MITFHFNKYGLNVNSNVYYDLLKCPLSLSITRSLLSLQCKHLFIDDLEFLCNFSLKINLYYYYYFRVTYSMHEFVFLILTRKWDLTGSSKMIINNYNTFENPDFRLLKFIPPIPESYCFVDENFQNDLFSVDGFVKRNSKKVNSLEKLKEELSSYMKIFDKSINNIKSPILKFKEETSQVQFRIEDVINQMNGKQKRLKTIRENKLRINLILEIMANLNSLESNISNEFIINEPSLDEKTLANSHFNFDQNATLVSKIQMNFDYLLPDMGNFEENSTHLLIKLKHRFDKCSQQFYEQLESDLYFFLDYDIAKLIIDDKLNELERIISSKLIRPHFDLIVCDSYIAKNGTQSMFSNILEFIDKKCALLIKVLTSKSLSQDNDSFILSPLGYELITNSIWKELVNDCLVRTPALFSLANVDIFYRNYTLTFQFIEDFLHKTGLSQYREQFENQKNFYQLKAKFNLNVYFFMKLQQIVPSIEKIISDKPFTPVEDNVNGDQYRLKITKTVHDCLFRCWHSNEHPVFVGDLFSYLWKLSLKIISRYCSFISMVNIDSLIQKENPSSTDAVNDKLVINHLATLIFDVQLFQINFTQLYQNTILTLWNIYFSRLQSRMRNMTKMSYKLDQSSLDISFNESMNTLHSIALQHLIEVLTSVQKTEESLKKLNLKKDRPMANKSNSMSDDNKIRLQIYYDVQEFRIQMKNELNIDLQTIKPYHDLSEMVNSLKILI